MTSTAPSITQLTRTHTGPKSKKNKKKKGKAKPNGSFVKTNGAKPNEENENQDVDEEEQEIPTPSEPSSPTKVNADEEPEAINGAEKTLNDPVVDLSGKSIAQESNGMHKQKSQSKRNSLVARPAAHDRTEVSSTEGTARLDAMAKEREALREEVAQLRKSLEDIQERHQEEMSSIREQLSQTEEGKEQAETQYQNLLGKVNTIRSQLGERLKADAVGDRQSQVPYKTDIQNRRTCPKQEAR